MPKRSPPVEETRTGNKTEGGTRGGAFAAALKRALTHWEGPAFLVSDSGELLGANAAGEARLRGDGEVTKELIARIKTQPTKAWVRCLQFALEGEDICVFAVEPGRPEGLEQRIQLATERWRLTERQSETLKLLAEGCSNQEIATALDCAVRTAEIHVGALLDKAKAKSRTGLIAAFWQLK